jgi:undecaprenyl phosphate N,N'-diacetylbacillosamine 1-phosphate transferase
MWATAEAITGPESAQAPAISKTLWRQCGKLLFDATFALVLLLLLSPILLVTALLVKLTSKGPIFFSQIRIGRDGRPFRVHKFRSMRGGRTPDPKELVPLDHPEITGIGQIIRRTKIDELPQLWCVLSGKMSLVGPRPTLPDQVEAYDDFQRQRLLIRPGCTGLAQVSGNTAIDWSERIKYDVYYVRHCSLALDIWILMRTVLVILHGEQRFARSYADSRFASEEPME